MFVIPVDQLKKVGYGIVVAVVIALMTVSAQTWKAAMTNPSNTLRYE
jgi:ABC-type lipoprotein release transport system permease subunit